VAHLRSLGTAGAAEVPRGSASHGEHAFWSTCGGCHRVGPRGGRLGPDLTRIGVTQSGDALRTSIRRASAAIAAGYQSVTLMTRDGTRIRGLRKAEDAFSVQIRHERTPAGLPEGRSASVTKDAASLMPDYGPDRRPTPTSTTSPHWRPGGLMRRLAVLVGVAGLGGGRGTAGHSTARQRPTRSPACAIRRGGHRGLRPALQPVIELTLANVHRLAAQ
jgi:putative heme-binding domain-containing protein